MKATNPQTMMSAADLKILKGAFPKEKLGVKVQSFSKDRTRAMLVLYLQHTDVQDRLEQVDPAWSSEVILENQIGNAYYVRLRLTVKHVSRENVGEGGDPKAAYSDALKRSAMLFGVGRYLYESQVVWTEYNEDRDRFRQWSIEDYDAALNKSERKTSTPAPKYTPAVRPGLTRAAVGIKPREELNRMLMNLYRPFLVQFPQTQFAQLLQGRYNVAETRLMTVEQLEDLIQFMEVKLRSVA
jgi:hypothetical protein